MVTAISHRQDNPPPADGLRISSPVSLSDWADAVALIDEYARSLAIDLTFQDLHKEIGDPAAQYSPPDGAFFLARLGGLLVGCAALRRFDGDTGEMKRLYVRPTARGRGIGRRLTELVVDAASEAGYQHLVLDTLATMTAGAGGLPLSRLQRSPTLPLQPGPWRRVTCHSTCASSLRPPRNTP